MLELNRVYQKDQNTICAPSCNTSVLAQLFNSYCTSFYGMVTWNFNDINIMEVAYRKAIRRVFKLPYNTHINITHGVSGTIPLKFNAQQRFLSLLKTMLTNNNKITMHYAHLSRYMSSTISGTNYFTLCKEHNFKINYIPKCFKKIIITSFYNSTRDNSLISLCLDTLNDIHNCTSILEKQELQHLLNFLCTS